MEDFVQEKKVRYTNLYMDIASRVAEMSHARRSKVGAILVNKGKIVSHGWNGMPTGWDNDCEIVLRQPVNRENLVTKPEVLHAEANLLMKLAKDGESSNGADLFITLTPCIECAKLIHVSGIKKVWYRDQYRDLSGIDFLEKCGINTEQVKITE